MEGMQFLPCRSRSVTSAQVSPANARCSHADLRFIIELGDSFVASLYSILDDPFVCLVLSPLLGSYAHPPFNPRDGITTLAPRAPARRGAHLRRLRLLLGVNIRAGSNCGVLQEMVI